MKNIIISAALLSALIQPVFGAELTKEEREQFEQEFCGEAWAHFLPDDQKFTAENVELAALQHMNPDSRCIQNIEQKEFDKIYKVNRPGFPRHSPSSGNSAFQTPLAIAA